MRITITIKGGSSSIEGEAPVETMDELVNTLNDGPNEQFIILDKTSHGDVVVNKSAIGYITRKQ